MSNTSIILQKKKNQIPKEPSNRSIHRGLPAYRNQHDLEICSRNERGRGVFSLGPRGLARHKKRRMATALSRRRQHNLEVHEELLYKRRNPLAATSSITQHHTQHPHSKNKNHLAMAKSGSRDKISPSRPSPPLRRPLLEKQMTTKSMDPGEDNVGSLSTLPQVA